MTLRAVNFQVEFKSQRVLFLREIYPLTELALFEPCGQSKALRAL